VTRRTMLAGVGALVVAGAAAGLSPAAAPGNRRIALNRAAAATSPMLAGSQGSSSDAPFATAAAPPPAWTPFLTPWAQAVDVRDLKRQLVRAGYQVKIDDSLGPVTKSAFADYLLPRSASWLAPGLAITLRGTVLLGRQNPVLWNRRFGLNRPTKFVERPLTGLGGQLDANGNIRDLK
jgi:hypothetical protein